MCVGGGGGDRFVNKYTVINDLAKELIENAIDVNVYTSAMPTLRTLYSQRVRWYRGLIDCLIKYKYMFFNRSYGNMGLFVLPSSVAAIFLAVLGVFYTLFMLSKH